MDLSGLLEDIRAVVGGGKVIGYSVELFQERTKDMVGVYSVCAWP